MSLPRVVFRGLRVWLAFAVVLAAPAAFAQQPPRPPGATAELLAEINRDIWTPFAKAYEAGDVEAYIRLHRPEFIRGEGTRKRVLGLEEYAANMRAFFAQQKERGARFSIAFRFTERLARNDLAHERGIFAFTLTPRDGAARTFYGKFHTAARKDGGAWRFVLDYDNNEGGTIDEAAFNGAKAQDDLPPFTS